MVTETTELGLIGLLKTLFYLIVFYQIGKFLFKWWLKRKVESHAEKMQNSMDEQQAAQAKRQEGHVSIKQPQQHKQSSGNSGEYVDFEEVK